ncbi:unnamed protein product [Allacma fusca]|uniref:Palmitoyltransferase n=1 Tax=Allacma fusca TaxID=39272 RepID=A0A8J2JU30_9HEXA|nr:unnamed protein product [Allacma fusca]
MGPYSSDTNEKMSKCKETKRYLPATFAWVLLLTTTTLFFVFPANYYVKEFTIWIPIGEAFLAVVVVANFTLATFMDPGIIPKATRGEDDNDDLRAPLYKTVEVSGITVRMKWCVTCQFYRPPRCSHCSVCNNCIETFDHHCPWVNNCIGRRNYRFFFMFLMSLSFHMAAIFSLCLYYLLHHVNRLTDWTTIISIGIMVVISLLIIPIFGLTGFHVVLVSRGRTTNEQVTGKYRGGYNPFSKGCCYNCWFTLCGPQYPGLARAKRNAVANHLAVVYQTPMGGTGGDNAYINSSPSGPGNQMLPSTSRDPDHELGSQSLDCEPTPPMQRQGSKSNFFLPSNNMIDETPVAHGRHIRGPYTHGSPHPNRQRKRRASQNCSTGGTDPNSTGTYQGIDTVLSGDGGRSRSHTPDSLSSPSDPGTSGNMASPTLQQKIRAIGGVPTPFAASASPMPRRSNPPTPTQVVRPDFIGLSHCGVSSNPHPHATRVHQPSVYYDSYNMNGEQRRFLSEGELLYDRQYHGVGMVNTPRDASGPIRELASSPQRGVYHWKDNSPTAPAASNYAPMASYFHSNPTSPIQHNVMNNSASNSAVNNRVYYHHGVASHPGFNSSPPSNYLISKSGVGAPVSPNMKKKYIASGGGAGDEGVRPSPISRRPMSFVRALEMTDSIDMTNSNRGANRSSPAGTPKGSSQIPVNDVSDRASVYDMNYEISV